MFSLLRSIKSMFSCRHYSELCCKSKDSKLSLRESFDHIFHHYICLACRRFSKQVDFIDTVCKKINTSEIDIKLSEEAKSRINSALADECSKNS